MQCIPTSHSSQASVVSSAVLETELTVSVSQKSTDTQSASTKITSRNTSATEISCESTPQNSQHSTYSLADSLVRLFQSLGNGKGLPTPEDLSFLRSSASSGIRDLTYCYLRTSRGFSVTTEGLHFPPSSSRLMNWGMTSSGRCLTARISACPRNVGGSLLSDILEECHDRKYFLSPEKLRYYLKTNFGAALYTVVKDCGVCGAILANGEPPSVAIRSDTLPQLNANDCRASRTDGPKE